MMEHVSACPLCSHARNTLFDRREFRGRTVENRLCRLCGLVFQSPRMITSELDKFYAEEYRSLYQGAEGPSEKDLKVQRGRAASLIAFLDGRVSPNSRHLDIGSSTGELLVKVRDVYGTESAGVEPGESYRKYAQDQGLIIYSSLEELKRANVQTFNLITLAHVLEHLPDPVAYLKDLRENYLALDGFLLLEVPNLYAHDSFEVAHLTAFSPHTLRQVLLQAGYQIVAFKKHGAPRSRILPLYLTLLARPSGAGSPTAVRPERLVSLKRRLGMFHRRVLSRLLPKLAWEPV